MSNDLEYRRRRQAKEARLIIVSQLYKKGYTVRKIREEVMRRLALNTYSISTVQSDINTLLKEWREYRLTNTEDLVQLELARIDDTVRELWEQWEKSKEDYVKTHRKRKGAPVRNNEQQDANTEGGIRTFSIEENTTNVIGLGDPAYISEIRQQLMERRKLLGLYAPEKKDITGDLSFAAFLMESSMIDDAENSLKQET